MTTRDDDSERKPPSRAGKPAPPMAGRIADVEPFKPQFEPPPGSLKAPAKPPVWRHDGKHTGKLAAASAPLPKTVELEMPEEPAIPPTRELEAPDGSGLFAETTYILNEAQLRGEQPAPLRADAGVVDEADEDRTDRFTLPESMLVAETDTIGDTPSPIFDEDDDPTGPQNPFSIFEDTTAILKDRALPPDDDDDPTKTS